MAVTVMGWMYWKVLCMKEMRKERKTYRGSCHCEALKFEVSAPRHLVVWNCNCSICNMRKNWHFVVPKKDFKLIEGKDYITEYNFLTGLARHTFCNKCGVQPFYNPRSNPDGYGITFHCVSKDQIESFEYKCFDGENWEKFYAGEGAAIKAHSKT